MINEPKIFATIIDTDRTSAIYLETNHRVSERNKHIEFKVYQIKESIKLGTLKPSSIPTKDQPPEILKRERNVYYLEKFYKLVIM